MRRDPIESFSHMGQYVILPGDERIPVPPSALHPCVSAGDYLERKSDGSMRVISRAEVEGRR